MDQVVGVALLRREEVYTVAQVLSAGPDYLHVHKH